MTSFLWLTIAMIVAGFALGSNFTVQNLTGSDWHAGDCGNTCFTSTACAGNLLCYQTLSDSLGPFIGKGNANYTIYPPPDSFAILTYNTFVTEITLFCLASLVWLTAFVEVIILFRDRNVDYLNTNIIPKVNNMQPMCGLQVSLMSCTAESCKDNFCEPDEEDEEDQPPTIKKKA